MRWDELFDDLEGQLEHELDTERGELLAEEERLRLGRLALRDRVLAVGAADPLVPLDLVLRDGTAIRVAVVASGRDWIVGEPADAIRTRRSCLVPLVAVASFVPRGDQLATSLGAGAIGSQPVGASGLGAHAAPPPFGDHDGPAGLGGRLGLAFAIRDLCRRRLPVEVRTRWATLHGTIDRVGRDHLDLAEHDPGSPRRRSAVRQTRLLAFDEVLLIRF